MKITVINKEFTKLRRTEDEIHQGYYNYFGITMIGEFLNVLLPLPIPSGYMGCSCFWGSVLKR